MEGNVINTDVSAVGAIVALSLIYMKCAATQNINCYIIFAQIFSFFECRSNNQEVANRIALPKSSYLLDRVRPDILFFKALGRCLILWDTVEPTEDWLAAGVPQVPVAIIM
jgi:anaphase-promoting complex subunit 1